MTGERVASVLIGGIILGIWLYGLLFGFDTDFNVAAWAGWGFMGLLLAGGVYAARGAGETPRLLIIAAIGVVVALVTTGAMIQENYYVWATVATLLGGGLILGAMPAPGSASHAAVAETDDG